MSIAAPSATRRLLLCCDQPDSPAALEASAAESLLGGTVTPLDSTGVAGPWVWGYGTQRVDVGGPPPECAAYTAVAIPSAVATGVPFVVSDVDSTLIQDEVIELLAAHAGREAEVAAVTERAMRGELDFAASLHERVAVLRGLPSHIIDDVVAAVRPTPGALELIRAVRTAGGHVFAVSGGFTQVLAPLAHAWGLSGFAANELEIRAGVLTGRVRGEVVDRAAKARWLRTWAAESGLDAAAALALGDGANDIDLLTSAGFGVSVCGKPALRAVADVDLPVAQLAPVAWMLGLQLP
ncbi:MAG: phosphoserine phosphatase SerB [Micrococcus sp.]|nr:phosphoserine phosphatase SerB [Micrococcus sp.]